MIGLSWQGVKAYADTQTKGNIQTGTFLIDPKDMTLKANVVDKSGKDLNLSIPIGQGQLTALKLLVRKFDKMRKPESIDGAALRIDWAHGVADVEIYYTKDFNKYTHGERHTFTPCG